MIPPLSSKPGATRKGQIALILLPMEAGRKTRHIALMTHRGGGWYDVRCMGEGKRCKAGECKHTANMRLGHRKGRPIRQRPREDK